FARSRRADRQWRNAAFRCGRVLGWRRSVAHAKGYGQDARSGDCVDSEDDYASWAWKLIRSFGAEELDHPLNARADWASGHKFATHGLQPRLPGDRSRRSVGPSFSLLLPVGESKRVGWARNGRYLQGVVRWGAKVIPGAAATVGRTEAHRLGAGSGLRRPRPRPHQCRGEPGC